MVNCKKESQQRCLSKSRGIATGRTKWAPGHCTHICVLGHRVQLKKQRALNYLAHLEEGRMHTRVRAQIPSHSLVPAPICTCVNVYTCLWTWMSEESGGPPVVYQPRNSSSLNTCLTGEKGARTHSISLNHPFLI